MPGPESPGIATSDRSVLPWPIVAGAFLHFALPVYLFAGLAGCAAGLLSGLTPSDLAAWVLPYSVRFALLYLTLAMVGTAMAATLDPLLRRRRRRLGRGESGARDMRSRRDLAIALAEGRAHLDPAAVSVLDALATMTWHHDESPFQSVSADLAQVVGAAVAALATVTPPRRQELTGVTTTALLRLATRLRDLQDERGRLDEGDLRTVARYIDSRYPPADCTGDSSN